MLIVRLVLSFLVSLIGILVIVRVLSVGIRPEIVPGLILGMAMVALGVHRMRLIRKALQ